MCITSGVIVGHQVKLWGSGGSCDLEGCPLCRRFILQLIWHTHHILSTDNLIDYFSSGGGLHMDRTICSPKGFSALGHHRTLISWESEAESDLAPPELGFSFFLFCFFFFLLAPRSPPGLLHAWAQTGKMPLTPLYLCSSCEQQPQQRRAANFSFPSNDWQLS